jgi:ATP synthase subunit epsilon, mitochondrial
MHYWRQAGLSYLRYSNICAQTVRKALKADKKLEAAVRDQTSIKNITQPK